MDLKDSIQILCAPGKGHSESSVFVEWHKDYCMKSHPSLHLAIEIEWENKRKECVNLFNASKFRLHRVDVEHSNKNISPVVKLLIGTTCYKDFIGTNCAPYAEQLFRDGMEHHANPHSYMSNPIGVGGLVATVDNFLIFIRRSQNCAELPGMIDRPGGHPEPDEVTSTTGQNLEDVESSAITEEIFQSVLKEIRDEVNIPLQELSSPTLLGISYNPGTWKRPSMEFYVSCYLTAKEVQELYMKQTQAESDESTEILVVPISEVLEKDVEALKFFNEFTHATISALYLLKIYLS